MYRHHSSRLTWWPSVIRAVFHLIHTLVALALFRAAYLSIRIEDVDDPLFAIYLSLLASIVMLIEIRSGILYLDHPIFLQKCCPMILESLVRCILYQYMGFLTLYVSSIADVAAWTIYPHQKGHSEELNQLILLGKGVIGTGFGLMVADGLARVFDFHDLLE